MVGKSLIHETYSTKNDLQLGIDETLRWLITYNPKEIAINELSTANKIKI